MSTREKVFSVLTAARSERNAQRSFRLFNEALQLAEEWQRTIGGSEPLIQQAQILSEMAYEESSPENRSQRWRKALALLKRSLTDGVSAEMASAYALLAVDCQQDSFSNVSEAARLEYLRTARGFVKTALEQPQADEMKGILLARKSSLLRHQAVYELSSQQKLSRLQESVRCADLAVNTSRQIGTILESAISKATWAPHELTDENYSEYLAEAERRFTDNPLRTDEVANLALCSFYKSTYRPLDVCETYLVITKRFKQVRRVLRGSYVYAEAVIQLRFANYPEEVVRKHLQEAKTLVELAVGSGYRDARLITAWAHLVAIVDGATAGETALSHLRTDGNKVSWEHVTELVTDADLSNPLAYGLALGIDQSSVWTSLGTFARRYLRDESLAEVFYRTAMKLDPRNPVALTNLARLLVLQGNESRWIEADQLLHLASSYSDRRYVWWRSVRALLNERKAQLRSLPKSNATALNARRHEPSTFKNIKELNDHFKVIEQLTNCQKRGYELEKLVCELARLTFGVTGSGAYRLKRPGGLRPQVDGYFETHKHEPYRVECKWENTPTGPKDVGFFVKKLDVAGGLFISMSGFTDGAVVEAKDAVKAGRPILLMDGNEARCVLARQIRFDELMYIKRWHLNRESNPYFKVEPADE